MKKNEKNQPTLHFWIFILEKTLFFFNKLDLLL